MEKLFLIPAVILIVILAWQLLVRKCTWCGGLGFRHGRGCHDCGKPWGPR